MSYDPTDDLPEPAHTGDITRCHLCNGPCVWQANICRDCGEPEDLCGCNL